MRALVIGDIHTEAELLERTIAHGRAVGVDEIISVGDIVDGPGDPLSCIAQLRANGAIVVRGNHERWVAQGHPMERFDYPPDVLAWISTLPASRELASPTGSILLGHGIGDHDMLRLESETSGYALECLEPLWKIVEARKYRWLLGGHTHHPMVRVIDGLVVVNAGTLVRQQDPGFVIADFTRGELEHWRLLPTLARHVTWTAIEPHDIDWRL